MTIPQEVADTIVDPKAYADGRIYESYAWLRANDPLGIAQPAGYDPFWVVTRHADILEISRQNDLFHSGDRATTIINKAGIRGVVLAAMRRHVDSLWCYRVVGEN